MAHILRRPMFRLGGSANEGITSGLGRQGYAHGGSHTYEERVGESAKERAAILRRTAGQTPDTSLSQFMIDFGLDIASRPPSGSIFSTAAAAAKDPFQRYKASKAARAGYEQKIGLTAATSAMAHEDKMDEIMTKYGMGGDEARKFNFKVEQYMRIRNVDRATAEQAILDTQEYSKVGHERPHVIRTEEIDRRAAEISERDDVSTDYAKTISEPIQDAIDGKFDTEGEDAADQISGRLDRNQLYIIEADIGERQGDDTYGIIQDRPEGDYETNKVYYNPIDGNFYWYDGNKRQFNLVVLGG
jgi:hypothetical protein